MPNLRCKVAVVGPATVGKTALIKSFHPKEGQFPSHYLMTLGADFVVQEVIVERDEAPEALTAAAGHLAAVPTTHIVPDEPVVKDSVALHIFDIAGSDLYEASTAKYVEGAGAFIIVYDVTARESVESVAKLVELCKTHSLKGAVGVLVGNKTDLETRAVINAGVGERLAVKHGLAFFETSAARGGPPVAAPFQHIAAKTLAAYHAKVAALTA